MKTIFVNFEKKDWVLWIVSLVLVFLSNVLSPQFDMLITIAALIGVTSLILGAKGSVWAQIFVIVFSLLYGVISFRFCYWGEMITYLGMTMPMAIWGAIVWLRNPSANPGEVAISPMTIKKWIVLIILSVVVTALFFYILRYYNTPNILVSTVSVTTSFMAASLGLLRSSYFPLLYASNDLVLIVLWVMATMEDPIYFPVIINFAIFFVNDFYGFLSWRKREKLCR